MVNRRRLPELLLIESRRRVARTARRMSDAMAQFDTCAVLTACWNIAISAFWMSVGVFAV
jgi:hypothetical protein